MTDIGFRLIGHIPADLLNADHVVEQVIAVINKHIDLVVQRGQYYPPAPASRGKRGYKRTYTLKSSWRTQSAHVNGDAIRGSVYNTATDKWGRHYASFVYGGSDMPQADVHAGRWPTREQLFDRSAFDQDLRAVVGGQS